MLITSEKSGISGSVKIPGSKSHTVRAVILAALAGGTSSIRFPLDSGDTRSALDAVRGFGATVAEEGDTWTVTGVDGVPKGRGQLIDVGNSGTTLYIALAAAGLNRTGSIRFDGDEQIRKRSAANLLESMSELGAGCSATGGCCPIEITGPLRGGATSIECPTSQFLTALLMSMPFAEGDTVITVPLLFEQPYVEMTLRWLDEVGISINYEEDFSRFEMNGGQRISSFDKAVPADFSSATFFLCAAAMTGSELLLEGLDMTDSQGDKAVVGYLRAMGAKISETAEGLKVHPGTLLKGAELDLNATPDALPMLAVAGACAEGETRLVNCPNARLKETDRISSMTSELTGLGVSVRELDDGMVVQGGGLPGGKVKGYGDHRIVMAFAVGGLAAEAPITVDTAEAAAITFPGFVEMLQSIGAEVEVAEQ